MPNTCQTTFRFIDQFGEPLVGATVTALLSGRSNLSSGGTVMNLDTPFTTDANGECVIQLIWSSEISGGGEYFVRVIRDDDLQPNLLFPFQVPDQAEAVAVIGQ